MEAAGPELLDDYLHLKDVQLRTRLEAEYGVYMAESNQVIRRALRAGHQPRSFLLSEKWLPQLRETFAEFGVDEEAVPIVVAPEAELAKLTGFNLHRGVLAAMNRPRPREVAEVLAGARRVLVLENLVDHTNVGAAFRSAAAVGYDAVLVTPSCADPLYRRAVRVSMGSVFTVPWARIADWPGGVAQLHKLGFEVAALELSETAVEIADYAAYLQAHPEVKVALVAGSEGPGITAATLRAVDKHVQIDMHNQVDSLNVAAACALACWATRVPPARQQCS